MEIHSEVAPLENAQADWLIVPVPEEGMNSAALQALDKALGGGVARLRDWGDFSGKLAELVPLRNVQGLAAKRLLLVGLGKSSELNVAKFERAMMSAVRSITDKPGLAAALAIPDGTSLSAAVLTELAVQSAIVGGVGQGLYRTERTRHPLASVRVVSSTKSDPKAAERGRVMGEAVNLARELVNLGPHDIYPESFAERARTAARQFGLKCDVLDVDRLRAERMESMLAVAVGSAQPARLAVLEHQGGKPGGPTLALVGKGVTFDSGGLSLKTNDQMLTMKCDMAGAATVLGAMTAIAQLQLPVNVVGYMGLVENLPSGTAFKLGDVLKARNGVTIEVLNTDAEGRLVLADVLSYAVDRGATNLIDLATLTGACVVALGEDVTGAFSNNQTWCDRVLAAAREAGEDLWPLPMFDLFNELIKSDVADIKNTGGRWGGAITAAKFLQRFVADKPWVHLDIAGPSFASSNKPHREAGGTGCLVRTLVEAARQFDA